MSEKKLDCAIVRDLLPLYHDDVVSDVTKDAVAEHLSECADCGVEYLKLSRELPAEEAVPPKKKFADLLRTRWKYRIIAGVTAAVLVLGLLTGGFFLQLQFPVVRIPGEEFTVERIYRYETEEEIRYFVILTYPWYSCMKITTDTEIWKVEKDGSKTLSNEFLSINAYKPLISWNNGMRSRILVIGCGVESVEEGIVRHDYKMLTCFNKSFRTKDLAETETPAYVYAYDWLERHGGSFSLNVENNWIGIECEDGVFRYWDLDGNELDAPPETE